MDNKDFSNIGEQILDRVQRAVDSMDFHELNHTVSKYGHGALKEVERQLKTRHAGHHDTHHTKTGDDRKPYQAKPLPRYPNIDADKAQSKSYVTGASKVGGILLTVFGSIGLGISGIGLLILPLIAVWVGMPPIVTVTIFSIWAVLTIGFGLILGIGNSIRGRIKRLKVYLSGANGRKYCSVEELAGSVGRSARFVVKDLRKIIQHRMLENTYLDEDKKWVMFSRETYQEYLQTQQALKKRECQEKNQLKENKKAGNRQEADSPPEADSLIAEGRAYLKILQEANAEISGEVISVKLTRLEVIIKKIFDSVSKHPQQKTEIQKFMEYYLPTTIKLVNAYREFDRVDTQGDNITTAKKEIEHTLDTINHAFEQLLDDLYRDAVFDVTSDASVLQTMLAGEGWTGSDFKQEDKS